MTDVVHELVEDALRELADEAYQRALWLASGGSEVSSLSECISRLWNDSGLILALERENEVYSAEIDEHFRQLRALLRRIDDSRAPAAILQDPILDRARSMASELLVDLRAFASGDGA